VRAGLAGLCRLRLTVRVHGSFVTAGLSPVPRTPMQGLFALALWAVCRLVGSLGWPRAVILYSTGRLPWPVEVECGVCTCAANGSCAASPPGTCVVRSCIPGRNWLSWLLVSGKNDCCTAHGSGVANRALSTDALAASLLHRCAMRFVCVWSQVWDSVAVAVARCCPVGHVCVLLKL
jgi:hypothetical protein